MLIGKKESETRVWETRVGWNARTCLRFAVIPNGDIETNKKKKHINLLSRKRCHGVSHLYLGAQPQLQTHNNATGSRARIVMYWGLYIAL